MQRYLTFLLSALVVPVSADTVGFWRFEDDGATVGGAITGTQNTQNPGTLDAAVNGGAPLYSDDVPMAMYRDPVSGETLTNTFSMDATEAESVLSVLNDVAFDTSFTVEMFIKITGEPEGFNSYIRREEFDDLSWQIDFDHNPNPGFGRIRSRWDTPAGTPDGVADPLVDENVNFTLAADGGASAPKVYVDTGAKDETGADVGPQNTGNSNDYVYNPDSTNPNEQDVALQGDGINDDDSWHHVALSFNEDTGQIQLYFDYGLAASRTLADTEGDGYTHPAADLLIGNISESTSGLLIDEVRFSNQILDPSSFLGAPEVELGVPLAHWRMDEEDAAEGGEILNLDNEISDMFDAMPVAGIPTYSTDVPGVAIFDPLTSTTYPNQFSLDATGGNARVGIPFDPAFDTSFTVEMFIKLIGEPGSFHTFLRRREQGDLRWQIDFDHSNQGAFGRARARFDTPAGAPDNVSEVGVDENVNFVVGPDGGGSIPDNQRLWIDTDLGDGMVSSYDDADWSMDGDGINDIERWHHIAVTMDDTTGTISFYFNGELMQTRTLADTENDGYTHPAGGLQFGKFNSVDYGLLMDEVRYTTGVLLPGQFLQAVEPAEPSDLLITDISYDPETNEAVIVWNSIPGRSYSLFRSADLSIPRENWEELLESEESTEATTSFGDTTLPDNTRKMFYFVRQDD